MPWTTCSATWLCHREESCFYLYLVWLSFVSVYAHCTPAMHCCLLTEPGSISFVTSLQALDSCCEVPPKPAHLQAEPQVLTAVQVLHPSNVLMALHRTCCSLSLLFLNCWPQNWARNSRCHLTELWAKGGDCFTQSTWYVAVNLDQDAAGLLCSLGTLQAQVQLAV